MDGVYITLVLRVQTKASSMLMLMEDLAAKKMEIEQTEEHKMLEETQVERTLAAAQDLVRSLPPLIPTLFSISSLLEATRTYW
jgi:sulfite reductase alpha subunit-like flavoprotein